MSPEREARILIVDDQREIARVLRTALELSNRGYFVIDVPSGEEAMLELRRGQFDVVVTDYRLPGMTGPELIGRVREQLPEAKAILITGHDLSEVKREVASLDVYRIFEKPIDTTAFTETVTVAMYGEIEVAEALPGTGPLTAPVPDFDQAPVTKLLSSLLVDLGARGIAFISRGGKVILKEGSVDDVPRFGELAVLLANNFTTTAEISAYLGDEPSTAVHYYDGSWYDIYALSVNVDFFIAIAFPGGSQKQMGPVLRYGKPAVQEMAEEIGVPALAEEEAEERIFELEAEPVEAVEEPAWSEEVEEEEELLEAPDLMLVREGEDVETLELDFDQLGLDLDGDVDNLDDFWDEAGMIETKVSDDALSLDEAVELGLIPKDAEIEE